MMFSSLQFNAGASNTASLVLEGLLVLICNFNLLRYMDLNLERERDKLWGNTLDGKASKETPLVSLY
jgi:hypothetical protein